MRITGYYPGVVGAVTQLHAVYYHKHWGFDQSFETQVGWEFSEFIESFDKTRDGFWAARIGDEFVGAIAIDGGRTERKGARLRWFIVAPEYQGTGIGSLLMRRAIRFCDRAGHQRIHLWTFEGLEAARKLYEREGFELCETHRVRQWGKVIYEQLFVLDLE